MRGKFSKRRAAPGGDEFEGDEFGGDEFGGDEFGGCPCGKDASAWQAA